MRTSRINASRSGRQAYYGPQARSVKHTSHQPHYTYGGAPDVRSRPRNMVHRREYLQEELGITVAAGLLGGFRKQVRVVSSTAARKEDIAGEMISDRWEQTLFTEIRTLQLRL